MQNAECRIAPLCILHSFSSSSPPHFSPRPAATSPPALAFYPHPRKNATFAFFLALLFAVGGVFLLELFDRRIKTIEVHDNGIGRDASETLRRVKAAQYIAAHPGEVCPAKWNEGAETLAPSLDLVGKI